MATTLLVLASTVSAQSLPYQLTDPQSYLPPGLNEGGQPATPGTGQPPPPLVPPPAAALGKLVWPQCLLPQPGRTQDCDRDGLSDSGEGLIGSFPDDHDSDNDWLTDLEEYVKGTNPQQKDTDGDCVPDWIEVQRGLNPLDGADGNGDLDADSFDVNTDGIYEIQWTGCREYRYHMPSYWDLVVDQAGPWLLGSHPAMSDHDGDSYKDGKEVFLVSNAVVYSYGPKEGWPQYGTDPVGDTGQVYTYNLEDNDGILYFREYFYNLSPYNVDSDGDGLCDGLGAGCGAMPSEQTFHTSGDLADTDRDGLTDFQEIARGAVDANHDGVPAPGDADNDADGLNDGLETSLGSNPDLVDSDGDGAYDGIEHAYGLNLLSPDSDGDLLTDGPEMTVFHADPLNPDMDGDSLSDGVEAQILKTNPRAPDTDFDFLPDPFEVAQGFLPSTHDSHLDHDEDGVATVMEYQLALNPRLADTSMDGMTDGWELHFRFDPTVTKAATSDVDNDGLPDAQEFLAGTIPIIADSDGDGLNDGAEANIYSTNPLHYDSDQDGLWDGEELNHWNTLGTNAWNTYYAQVPIPGATTCLLTPNLEENYVDGCIATATPFSMCHYLTANPPGSGCTPGSLGPFGTAVEHNNLLDPDADKDGLTDREEFKITGTSPALFRTYSANDVFDVRAEMPHGNPLGDSVDFDQHSIVEVAGLAISDFVWAHRYAEHHTNLRNPIDGSQLVQGLAPFCPSCTFGDEDGDGLLSWWEDYSVGTDPLVADTDCDGLADGLEMRAWIAAGMLTTPQLLDPDSDDDGILDGEEFGLFGDGLSRAFTNPGNADTDGDGLTDLEEQRLPRSTISAGGLTITPTYQACTASIVTVDPPLMATPPTSTSSSSPIGPCSDAAADLITQFVKERYQLLPSNPVLPDSDWDGLSDHCENHIGTNPLDCDSEQPGGDGLSDGLEMGVGEHIGLMPYPVTGVRHHEDVCTQTDSDPYSVTNPLSFNSDGDLCSDETPTPVPLYDGVEDSDENGRMDTVIDGDPNDTDTDDDGIPDCDEAMALNQPATFNNNFKIILISLTDRDADNDLIEDPCDGPTDLLVCTPGNLPAQYTSLRLQFERSYPTIWWEDAKDPKDGPNDIHGIGFRDDDQDDDTLLDGEEFELSGSPHANADEDTVELGEYVVAQSNLVDSDSDDDGLADPFEKRGDNTELIGLDMEEEDADGDGLPDGVDFIPDVAEGATGLLFLEFGMAELLDATDITCCAGQQPFIAMIQVSLGSESDATKISLLPKDIMNNLVLASSDENGIVNDLPPGAPPVGVPIDLVNVPAGIPDAAKLLDQDLINYRPALDYSGGVMTLVFRIRAEEYDCMYASFTIIWACVDEFDDDDHLDINDLPDQQDYVKPISIGFGTIGNSGFNELDNMKADEQDCGMPNDPERCDDANIEFSLGIGGGPNPQLPGGNPKILGSIIKVSCRLSEINSMCQLPGAHGDPR